MSEEVELLETHQVTIVTWSAGLKTLVLGNARVAGMLRPLNALGSSSVNERRRHRRGREEHKAEYGDNWSLELHGDVDLARSESGVAVDFE